MPTTALPDGRVPVVLSAHAEDLVRADAEAILRYLDRTPDVASVAATLLRTRRLRRHRAVVRAADLDELAAGLRAIATGEDHPLVARCARTGAPRTAFVFPGQGGQWPSMGADAYRRSTVYRTHADRCAEAFVGVAGQSPLPYLTAEAGGGDWSQVQIQAAQFTHAVGLAEVWRSCGVLPDITLGHSLGEVAAAYVAGVMSLADAAAVVVARANVVEALTGGYRMAALGVSAGDAEKLVTAISPTSGWLEISAVNSDSSVVVSGDRDAITRLVHGAAEKNLFVRELEVDYPGHTSALEPLRDGLRAQLPAGEFLDSPVQFVSSATSQVVSAGVSYVDYWYANLRNTVRFDRAAAVARQLGAETFVEMSAHPSLLFALGELTDDHAAPTVVGSGARDVPFVDAVSAGICAAATADPGYRWSGLVDVDRPLSQGFPNAPMRADRFWAQPEPLAPVHGVTVSHEIWQETTDLETPTTERRLAVIGMTGPSGPLAGRLREAVRDHRVAKLVDPRDADLLVAVAPVLDHPETELAVAEIAGLLGDGLLDYPAAAGPACREVCLVTVGGEQVRPDEPVALPAQAALAAMHRSVAHEHPDQAFRHLDLPSWELDDAVAAGAVDALLGGVHEGALRQTTGQVGLFVRTMSEATQQAAEWPLDDGLLDDVVITGGSGAVGLHFAASLAERGARRIVLLSRGGLDAAAAAEIAGRGLRENVDIVAPRCDIRSADDVSAAARAHGGEGASLMIHAAGTAAFADRAAVTADGFADTAAAKIGGLARMVQLWPLRAGARIVVCSSVSGVWGGRGHVSYSAVNRMLDVMAGQLRAEGQHCVAARYGLWRTDPGRRSAITDGPGVADIARAGLLPMPPDLAVAASLRDHWADPLIITADQDRLRMFLDSAPTGRTGSAAPPSDGEADTPTRVREEIAAVLNVDAAIDLTTSLLDLGLDSLLALELRNRLRRATGKSVALAALLGGITGGELIAALDTRERPEGGDHA
ncbi:mycobactin polyketide synthase MbtD [Mycolicibacterium sp. XJ1819]